MAQLCNNDQIGVIRYRDKTININSYVVGSNKTVIKIYGILRRYNLIK